MADIVLATINAKWIHPSLALRLLKVNLGEYESRCEIVELTLHQSLEEKRSILAGFRPKILGFSVSIWNHKATLELLKELRKSGNTGSVPGGVPAMAESGNFSRPVIVLGGPEVTYIPEESEIICYADFVIQGEGEKAFAELCKRILAGEKLPSRFVDSRILDVANIYPAYHLYSNEDLRRKLIYVEASRDCPFTCAFCQSAIKPSVFTDGAVGFAEFSSMPETGSGMSRRKILREFPLDDFLSNMEDLLERLFSVRSVSGKTLPRPTIKFLDRSFNADIPRALSIMEFFLEKASSFFNGFQLHFEMVPSLFPPELIKMISRFPPDTLRLELGIQSFNQKVCAAISRPSRPEKELETLALLRAQTDAIIHADLIAGLPGENFASFAEGFDRLWQALTASAGKAAAGIVPSAAADVEPSGAAGFPPASAAFEIQLGILKGLPGTPLRELDTQFGMVYSPEPPYEVIETVAMGKADLDRLRNFARFWELIVNRPWKTASRINSQIPAENPAAALLVPGKPVFWPFMELSEKLFRFFGRNWSIDRKALAFEIMSALRPL
jgi:radical SAM superfamily enzyme YgiQ (UPF0313 family)